MKIGIVGGGISGLAVGIALARKGFVPTIFEKNRRNEVAEDNDDYPLIIRLPGILALEELELIEKIKSHSSELKGMYAFVQSNGRNLLFGPLFEIIRNPILINKNTLKNILLHECLERGVEILWNHHVSDFEEEYHVPPELHHDEAFVRYLSATHLPKKEIQDILDKWEKLTVKVAVKLNDGHLHPQLFDVLIGADGIHSAIRRRLFDDELKYLGLTSIFGILEDTDAPHVFKEPHLKGVMTVIGKDGTSLYLISHHPQKIMWFFTIPSKENAIQSKFGKDTQSLKELIASLVSNWFPIARDIIAKTRSENIKKIFDLYDRDPLDLFSTPSSSITGRVTLLGDAAFPASPFQGRGVNFALGTAVILAEDLSAVPLTEKYTQMSLTELEEQKKKGLREAEILAMDMMKIPSSRRIPYAIKFYENQASKSGKIHVHFSRKVTKEIHTQNILRQYWRNFKMRLSQRKTIRMLPKIR